MTATTTIRAAEMTLDETKAIAEEGFIYGLPIVMNYAVMYECSVDKNSGQYKGPLNQINNEARVFTYEDTSVQLLIRNVIQSGDSMTIWIDRTAMLYRRAVIATTYEGNPVTTTANYAMLPSGQVHMAQAILNYPKKQVVVQLDNMDYSR